MTQRRGDIAFFPSSAGLQRSIAALGDGTSGAEDDGARAELASPLTFDPLARSPAAEEGERSFLEELGVEKTRLDGWREAARGFEVCRSLEEVDAAMRHVGEEARNKVGWGGERVSEGEGVGMGVGGWEWKAGGS